MAIINRYVFKVMVIIINSLVQNNSGINSDGYYLAIINS
jgi:hypothetical protein